MRYLAIEEITPGLWISLRPACFSGLYFHTFIFTTSLRINSDLADADPYHRFSGNDNGHTIESTTGSKFPFVPGAEF